MFKGMSGGMGGAGASMDDSYPDGDAFMSMMQGMMENLLSKDLLYPSLKEIKDKVHCCYIVTLIKT